MEFLSSLQGYMLAMGGPPGTNASQWQCVNRTIDPSPSTCVINNFWSFPSNASYVGVKQVVQQGQKSGVECDMWSYWLASEEYQFFALANKSVPVRISKVKTAHPGYHRWHIDFFDFKPGSPPLKDYAVPTGVKCENATSIDSEQARALATSTVSKLVDKMGMAMPQRGWPVRPVGRSS